MSALPFSPLTWAEINERRDEAKGFLGIRAVLAIERDDFRYLTDDGAELVATYREMQAASSVRFGR
jgi:hypothetical protein